MSDQKEKTKDKKKKKKLRKCLRHVNRGIILFLLGVFVGMHWKVIRALVKGEELPEVPAGHCHIFCRK